MALIDKLVSRMLGNGGQSPYISMGIQVHLVSLLPDLSRNGGGGGGGGGGGVL